MTVAGLDVGTGGARAVVIGAGGELRARVAGPLPGGTRTEDGGHRLDERPILEGALTVLGEACRRAGGPVEIVAVSSTSGTLCFRDASGRAAAAAVAYDDTRHGEGLARVRAWWEATPAAVRVIPLADAVLELLGADPGQTDWTNALKLGWDPDRLGWPAAGDPSTLTGFLPDVVPPGTPCGRVREGRPPAGARLVRGATDSCAVHIASGPLRRGDWSISLGTTLAWKTVSHERPSGLPAGAYAHRLGEHLWLPGAAGNCGGGVLEALEPGADLAARDREAVLPSRVVAYPLARPGERFPIPHPAFRGFGLPPRGHSALHAAILEGTAYVIRYGIERLAGGGIPEPDTIRVTGGGAGSATWMSVIASVVRRPVTAAPRIDAALGAALIALAALRGEPVGSCAAAPEALGPVREHPVDQGLRPAYAGGYSTFLDRLRTELGDPSGAAAG